MNLIKQAYGDIFSSDEDIMVGYLSGVRKRENNGCILDLNFRDPKADVAECLKKLIPTEGIHVDSETSGYNDLYNEPDLMVGDIIVAVVEDDDDFDLWKAKKVMKVDRGMLKVFLSQLKALDDRLVKIE